MYFTQDSLIPGKINLSVKIISNIYHFGSEQDSVYVDWGDGGGSFLYLRDSVLIPGLGYPLFDATYTGTHLYTGASLDTIMTIGYGDGARLPSIININQSEFRYFYIRSLLNFPVLKKMLGYKSPRFNASLYAMDTVNTAVTYDPDFNVYNSYNTSVHLTEPFGGGYKYPNHVCFGCSDTILTCDTTTGLFYWYRPYFTSFYDITYEAVQRYNDTLVSAIMQDMLINVLSTPTSISDIDATEQNIYPNPVKDKIYLSTTFEYESVVVYDASGMKLSVPISPKEINVSELAKGVYTLRLLNKEGTAVRRFVKE
jgi:hypothetical protein